MLRHVYTLNQFSSQEQICICGARKQVLIWKQTHHRGSDQYSAWGYSKTPGHTQDRQTKMFSQTFHCTFSTKYNMLYKKYYPLCCGLGQRLKKELEECYYLRSFSLEEDFKTTSWNNWWAAALQASVQALQATAALSSSVISLFLVSSQISYVAAMQIYPSHSSLNYYLCLPSSILCIKWWMNLW